MPPFRSFRSLSKIALTATTAAWAIAPAPAHAWLSHHLFMPGVLQGLSRQVQNRLFEDFKIACPTTAGLRAGQGIAAYLKFAEELKLNPSAPVSAMLPELCENGDMFTATDVLNNVYVDDPDRGIDEDLDDGTDPHGDRPRMGGKRGTESRLFRHMYWGGFSVFSPLQTLQLPLDAVGIAPTRADLLARRARALLKTGESAWAFRILAWAIHYLQDLAEPYHVVQNASLTLLPWSTLLSWNPFGQAGAFWQESRRIADNHRLALDRYVSFRLKQSEPSIFHDCLHQPENYATIRWREMIDPKGNVLVPPHQIAREVAAAAQEIAAPLARAQDKLFGPRLSAPDTDLRQGRDEPDYEEVSVSPTLTEARDRLHPPLCQTLANASLASRLLIQWALQPEAAR